jgi:N-acetylmuramoyl-L-alanine amidase
MSRETNKRSARKAAARDISAPVPERLRQGVTWLVLAIAAGTILYLLIRNAGPLLDQAGAAGPVAAVTAGPEPRVAITAAALAETGATPLAQAAAPRSGRIGIVSGHRGNDSGAVCASDGLTEAEVNFDHASRAADLLRKAGYEVDILDEKDERLNGYKADAYISIHADSCIYINELATGYKVARSVHSALPAEEDRFVACVSARYKAATGLRFHRNTVTHNMTEYHGFYKIDARTPSIILETGFLAKDRDLLTQRADDVAYGIAQGVLCFLRNETP